MKKFLFIFLVLTSCTTGIKDAETVKNSEKMLSVNSINQTSTDWINVSKINSVAGRPHKMKLKGELGFRASRNIRRIKEELPYAEEYLLGQISGEEGLWSNFARFHGDIAGRYILAMTYAESNNDNPPGYLQDLLDKTIALQNDDGSFGVIQYEENPLNMHKAYGNGWMLKALSQYAITFQQKEAENAAVKLGDFYVRTYHDWEAGPENEVRDDGNYAVSRSGYFHGFDGLITLFRLTNDKKYFDLAEKFVPLLTPLSDSDHAHMYLTSRRGLLEYYSLIGDASSIASLTEELKTVYETFIFETGGVPERLVHDEQKRNDPKGHGDDEACGLFDWEILTLRMFEVTGDHIWIEHAILNLENAIYYNQTHNYGFGACSMGSVYKERRKEAPWCCTLFGPYGLLESSSCWVSKKSGILEINHMVSGEFEFEGGELAILTSDNEKGILTVELKNRNEIESVSLHIPHWLKTEDVAGSFENGRLKLEVPASGILEIPYSYKVWMSGSRTSPEKTDSFKDGETGVLFYGPWLLAHHFPNDIQVMNLQLDEEGYITNFSKEYIRGINIYGESTRIVITSDIKMDPNDTSLGIAEKTGELYLYPFRDRESVWSSATELRFKHLTE